MRLRYKVLIAVVALAGAYGAGRWASPEKIKTEIKVVEVEKKTKEKNIRKKTTIKEITRPDGSKEQDTVIIYDSSDKETTDKTVSSDETNEKTWSTSKVTISALAGYDFKSGLVYGASVSKPVLGPLTIGVYYLSNGSLGASVGVTF